MVSLVNTQEYTRKVLLEPSIPAPETLFYKEFINKKRCNLYLLKGDINKVKREITVYYNNGGDDIKYEQLSYIGKNKFPKYQIKDRFTPFKYRNSSLYKIYSSFYL